MEWGLVSRGEIIKKHQLSGWQKLVSSSAVSGERPDSSLGDFLTVEWIMDYFSVKKWQWGYKVKENKRNGDLLNSELWGKKNSYKMVLFCLGTRMNQHIIRLPRELIWDKKTLKEKSISLFWIFWICGTSSWQAKFGYACFSYLHLKNL